MRIDIQAPEKDKIAAALKSDPIVANLLGMTYPQIDAWVDANITTLAAVINVLKRLIKIFIFLIRHFKIA